MEESPFLYLTCDLPQPPLFKDEKKENIIPQVSLYVLLSKFDGKTGKEYQTYKENILKKFQLTGLPPYLILYNKRFTKNTFYIEKNPTIVNFPVKNIDLTEYLTEEVKQKHPEPIYDLVAILCMMVSQRQEPTDVTYSTRAPENGMNCKIFTLKKLSLRC
ncbi:putative U4/U6.U5 tri-snRNP-associated protein 2 [Penaeus vannamei]|uniref:ubiquitinyl hydrolase 1 n=1 Tax=Penaeus vannamei TaxID=6689 RepID=A0A3R7PXC1_PENVA|nr:putative U4/U6.U5 tri-snRNP-associated protein 2 [Penaeus vannamei]